MAAPLLDAQKPRQQNRRGPHQRSSRFDAQRVLQVPEGLIYESTIVFQAKCLFVLISDAESTTKIEVLHLKRGRLSRVNKQLPGLSKGLGLQDLTSNVAAQTHRFNGLK